MTTRRITAPDAEREATVHRSHLTVCAIGVALAAAFVAVTGASAGSLGLLVAALACPVAMGAAMWLLMGGSRRDVPAHRDATDRPSSL